MRFAFNNFVLDCEQRVLWAQGQVVPLSPKVFDTLRLLVLAGGRIVTKQEFMDELWPDSFVEDGNLTQNIFILRRILGTTADGGPYIETVPRRGYRFLGAVQSEEIEPPAAEVIAEVPTEAATEFMIAGSEPAIDTAEPIEDDAHLTASFDQERPVPPYNRNRVWFASVSFLLVLVAGIYAIAHWRAQGHISGIVRLTNDGGSKDLRVTRSTLVTDGRTLYFDEEKDNAGLLAQVSVHGGETSYSEVPSPKSHLVGFGPGGRSLLFGSKWKIKVDQPLLDMTLPGGALPGTALSTGTATPVFDIQAQDANWSPDGTRLAFAQSGKLFVRSADSSTHLIASMEGLVYWPRWSPDGRTIRFSENYEGYHDRLWEVDSAGGEVRQLFAGQPDSDHVCCGTWSSTGRSFVYLSIQANNNSIHVRPAAPGAWDPLEQAIDLPAAPLDQWVSPVPDPDGTHIFAIGEQLHGRLVRIDPNTRRPETFLGGLSAEGVSYSPDGADIVWTAYPEGTLWRSHSDGTGRVQLSQTPLIARFPRWSPDGQTIVFTAARPGSDWTLYTVPANGGEIKTLVPENSGQGVATWSADGRSLAFGHIFDMVKAQTHPFVIETLRMSDRKVTLVPGSAGMWTARWSPNGRFISAVTTDNRTLRLYDVQTSTWTDLAHGSVNDVVWAPDSESLFFDTVLGAGPVLYRVRIKDRKLETYATLNNFRRAGFFAPWLGVAPDGSPILLEDSSIQEVYSVAVNLR